MIATVVSVVQIVFVNLILSGDNALVIGMASHNLEARQRRRAIVWGGAAAVVLRVLFTIAAALLLAIPYLQVVGGLVLAWVAVGLLKEEGEEGEGRVPAAATVMEAVRTIVIADVAMSLDNVLAIAGVAQDNVGLLLVGLGISIPIVLLGASILSVLMRRFHWLIWLGSAILGWTAGDMIVNDDGLAQYLTGLPYIQWIFPAVTVVLVVSVATMLHYIRRSAVSPHPS